MPAADTQLRLPRPPQSHRRAHPQHQEQGLINHQHGTRDEPEIETKHTNETRLDEDIAPTPGTVKEKRNRAS